jgi:hypothetical protein
MKMHLVALVGLAISFAVPTLAQQTNKPDPQVRQQLDALAKKFDEAYDNNDAAAVAALWLFRRYAFGCRRILAMLDPAGMAERFNAPVRKPIIRLGISRSHWNKYEPMRCFAHRFQFVSVNILSTVFVCFSDSAQRPEQGRR